MSVPYHWPIIFLAHDSSRLTTIAGGAPEMARQSCYGDTAREGRAPVAGQTAAFITCWGVLGHTWQADHPHMYEHTFIQTEVSYKISKSLRKAMQHLRHLIKWHFLKHRNNSKGSTSLGEWETWHAEQLGFIHLKQLDWECHRYGNYGNKLQTCILL